MAFPELRETGRTISLAATAALDPKLAWDSSPNDF